jgi:hypothetical protein
MSCSKKIKVSGSERDFQEWWTPKYGMILKNNKSLCVLCSESVVCRTSSVKRHFETIHKTLLTKSADEQKSYIARALCNKNLQSNTLVKFVKSSDSLISASFDVAKSIAIRGKPFGDGDFIKMAWLDCADNLFNDFNNKDKIIQRIKDLSISRNTIKERILSMNSNIESQLINDLNKSTFYSICVDESTDITSSARLSVISRFCNNNEVREELIKLASIPAKTTGENICEVVVNVLENAGLDLSKIVSVTTDGAPSMVGKDRGFVTLFSKRIDHPLIGFHCLIHQEALCAKDGLMQYANILKLVTKIVNFINARALNKRQFCLLLEEVNSMHKGLVMYNNVRWLTRGHLLERFVECLHEIRLFLSDNQNNYVELTDLNWLCNLMFFTDFCLHLNELNLKLQGTGKSLDFMFSLIKGFEVKLNVFIRDIENRKFKYFKYLKKFLSEIEINETIKLDENINIFLNIIRETIQQFKIRFNDFKKFECNIKFLKYPDTCNIDELDLHYFEWMNIDTFEFELIDLQSCNTWKQKFIDARQLMEQIEINRLQGNEVKNADNEILKAWNSLPDTFYTLKKVARSMLSIFSSTYACESLFSIMNLIKSKERNGLTDETSAACVSLKITNYTPDIKTLSSKKQQQKSH